MRGFSKKQLKSIISNILTKEIYDNNLDYKYAIGDFKDLCAVIKKNKNYTEEQRKAYINSFDKDTIAYHTEANNGIIVFIDRIKKFKTVEKQLFVTMFSCYHEVRHAIQNNFDEFSYEKFISEMENLYRKDHYDHYRQCHDSYSFEIGANLYACNKTITFLKEIYPEAFEKEKNFIEGLRLKTLLNYYSYDANFFISNVVDNIINYKTVPDNKILNIFFNEDGEFKKISDIINNNDYNKLDKKIVYYMFSACMSLINLKELSDDELNVVLDSTNYVLNVYKNQEKYILKKQKLND